VFPAQATVHFNANAYCKAHNPLWHKHQEFVLALLALIDKRILLPVWQSAEQDADKVNFQSKSIQASFYFRKSFK